MSTRQVFKAGEVVNMFTGVMWRDEKDDWWQKTAPTNRFNFPLKTRPEFARHSSWLAWYQGDILYTGQPPGVPVARLGSGFIWVNPALRHMLIGKKEVATLVAGKLYWEERIREVDPANTEYFVPPEIKRPIYETQGVDQPFNKVETPHYPAAHTHHENMDWMVANYTHPERLNKRVYTESVIQEKDIEFYADHFGVPVPHPEKIRETNQKLTIKAVKNKLAA